MNKIVSKLEKGVASWAKCKLLSSAGSMGGPELVSAQINHAFRNRDTPPRSLKRDNIRIPNNVWKVGTTWSWLILERLSTRETRYTHTYTRLYIYIYIHITWLNKILDSLTLPISLPSIEPGVPRWNSNDPLDPFRSPPDFFQSNISYQLRASISISRLKLPISPPGIWKATWKRSRSYAPLYYPCFKNLMFLSAREASRFRFNDDSFVVLFATSLVFFSNDLKKKRENTGDRFREIYTWKSYIFRHRIFFISVLVFFSSA